METSDNPYWARGASFASMKAQSPNWIAIGRLRSNSAGLRRTNLDSKILK